MNKQTEAQIQADYTELALEIGNQILQHLMAADRQRFSAWMADCALSKTPRFALKMKLGLVTADEMQTDRTLTAEIVVDDGDRGGTH